MRYALPRTLAHVVNRRPTPQARSVVLSLIKEKQPLTVQELYNLVQEQQAHEAPSTAEADSSEPVIPSMRYLKRVILPDLEQSGKVEKAHTKQTLTEAELEALKANMGKKSKKASTLPSHVQLWRWQLKEAKPQEPAPEETKLYGSEVGLGADWSHLNKRRQRGRQEKVREDMKWLKQLRQAREDSPAS
ncbi:hypothetical protein VTO73DRAFT_11224 [Trametes versicolor]